MDYAEEQEMELEALEAMYMDEYKSIDATSFSIRLVPVQGGTEEENHVVVDLVCKYTPKYPEELPDLSVKVVRGLTDKQVVALTGVITVCAEENIGMPMVYTITDVVVQWLLDNNRPMSDGSIFAEMQERERLKKEAAQKAEDATKRAEAKAKQFERDSVQGKMKRFGTPVTKENFNEWNEVFISEYNIKCKMEEEKRMTILSSQTKASKGKDVVILTGKQLFEADIKLISSDADFLATLAAEEDEIFGSDILKAKPEEANATALDGVDASLFQDFDVE